MLSNKQGLKICLVSKQGCILIFFDQLLPTVLLLSGDFDGQIPQILNKLGLIHYLSRCGEVPPEKF